MTTKTTTRISNIADVLWGTCELQKNEKITSRYIGRVALKTSIAILSGFAIMAGGVTASWAVERLISVLFS